MVDYTSAYNTIDPYEIEHNNQMMMMNGNTHSLMDMKAPGGGSVPIMQPSLVSNHYVTNGQIQATSANGPEAWFDSDV